MSLQRVFESARKLGVPVIVTDPAGRDPMVVMPLEQFEAMNDVEASPKPKNGGVERHVEQAPKIDPVSDGIGPLPAEPSEIPEISLEERFYLEPVEGESEA